MANKFHKNLIELDNHAITGAPPYANITARNDDTAFNTNPANVNKVVRVTDADGLGTIGYFILVSIAPAWESLGASLTDSFLELIDVDPTTYVGQAGKVVQVNNNPDGLEFGQDLRTSASPSFAGLTVDGNALIQSSTDSVTAFRVLKNAGGTPIFNVDTINGRVGINVITPLSASLEVETLSDTTIGFIVEPGDGNQTADFVNVINFAQNILFSIGATGTALFQNDFDSLTAFQILDANGGVPIFNVDSTNERVGIGNAAPTTTLDLLGNVLFTNDVAGNVAFTVIGATSQSADLINIIDDSAVTRFSVDFDGDSSIEGSLTIETKNAATIGLIVNSVFVGQTADFVQVIDSAATLLFSVDPDGTLFVAGAFKDSGGNVGTSGQILSSTVIGTDWIDNDTGNVSNVGTPVDNQIAIWTDSTTIEGDPNLTFDGIKFDVTGNGLFTSSNVNVVAFLIDGKLGQIANIFDVRNSVGTVLTSINPVGNFLVNSFDSTTTNPRTISIGPMSGVEAARFQFGSEFVCMQHLAGGTIDIVSFATLRLFGDRNTTAPAFSSESDIGVHVINSVTTTPALVVSGAASQTADLFQARDSAGEVLALVEPAGGIHSKGISWTLRTTPSDNSWLNVTYGNGLFVAVANGGTGDRVMTSPDGVNWTVGTSAADNSWFSVVYGNGLFVAVANSGFENRVMTSPDGINWTTRKNSIDNGWRSVTYGNNLFVAVANTGGTDRVMTSPDGVNWTTRISPTNNNWTGVVFGNGLFVAVSETGSDDRVMTSTDGITWNTRLSAADHGWLGIAYGNGIFVTVAFSGAGDRVMTSFDGINWTTRTPAAANNWIGVTYGNGLFVAVSLTGSGDRVMTSTDGITWISRVSANDNSWFAVTYGNGLFVSLANGGTAGMRAMTSGKTEINEISQNNILQGGLEVRGSFAVDRSGTAVSANTEEEVIIGVTDTSVGRTITIQTKNILGSSKLFIIKDESGAASNPNPITIATEAAETIDGLTSVQITTPYGVVRLYSDGANLFSW